MGLLRGGIITTSSAGGGGGALPSGTSGVLSVNSEYGPHITLSSDASIQITKPTTNNIQFSCSGFVSGVQQQIEAKLAVSGQELLTIINTSGQVLLSENNASGQYIWTQLNASGQYLWNELGVSGQLLRNEIAESGQVLLSNVVRSVGVQGGADIKGDVDFTSTSGFVIMGDNAGSSPIAFDVDIHALSGFWALGSLGAGNVTSVGVQGGADLIGDIDFSDPSGFIVWGDTAGANPITASIDVHALSGLWGLNQININKNNIDNKPNKYYGYFNNFSSGYFNHGLNTQLLTWNVYASGTTVEAVDPDRFRVMDENHIFLKFNSPETGFVVIMG